MFYVTLKYQIYVNIHPSNLILLESGMYDFDVYKYFILEGISFSFQLTSLLDENLLLNDHTQRSHQLLLE